MGDAALVVEKRRDMRVPKEADRSCQRRESNVVLIRRQEIFVFIGRRTVNDADPGVDLERARREPADRKSTRLNSSH